MVFNRRLPSTGDVVEWAGRRLEVVDMDGRRVDKVLFASAHSDQSKAPSPLPSDKSDEQ
jgi:putative hemolysin